MRRSGSAQKIRAALTAVVAAGVGGLACWALADASAASWAALQRPVPTPDDVVALLAASAGLALCGWWTAGATLTALATLAQDGAHGASWLARAARALTPGVIRRAVAVAAGVCLVAGGTAAHAAPTSPTAYSTQTAAPAASATRLAPATRQTHATLTARADELVGDHPDLGWGAVPPPGPSAVVVVRPGDTLWALAERQLTQPLPAPGRSAGHATRRPATDAQVARAWPGWFAANRAVIGADPNHLEPGQHLVPPA